MLMEGQPEDLQPKLQDKHYIGLQLKGPSKTDKKQSLMDEIHLDQLFHSGFVYSL